MPCLRYIWGICKIFEVFYLLPRRVEIYASLDEKSRRRNCGENVRVIVMQVKGKRVRLGIADPATAVHREEVGKIQDENKRAIEQISNL